MTHLTHVTLILTYACQLRCKMCGQVAGPAEAPNSNQSKEHLPFDLVRQRLDEQESVRSTYLFGGEPLLYKEMPSLLNYLRDRRVTTGFTTNGLLLKKFASTIIASHVENVAVSIDSHLVDIHDSIRGVTGCLEKALGGLDCLLDEREKANAKYPRVEIHFTINPDNYTTMIDYYDHYVRRLPKVDQIMFHFPRFATQEMGREYTRIMREEFDTEALSWLGGFSDEDYNEAYTQIDVDLLHGQLKELLKRPKTFIIGPVDKSEILQYFHEPHVMPKGRACSCFNACSIQPNGDVVTCADYPDYVIGNIHEQPLSEIWEGEKARHWREYLMTHDHPGVLVKCSRLYPPVRGGVYRFIPRQIYQAIKLSKDNQARQE